jgi:hypothetical protein
VSTVREAQESLRAGSIGANGSSEVHRQGEWFFVEATSEELGAIDGNLFLIERKAPVGDGGGRPHVVDEAVSIPGGGGRFVRGSVRHPDHYTLRLRAWCRLHLNGEVRASEIQGVRMPSVFRADGVLWID